MKNELEQDSASPIAVEELSPDVTNEDRNRGRDIGHGHGNPSADHSNVPGWGSDLARNRPRNMQPEEPHPLAESKPLADQPLSVEILRSTERPGLTPLFGTSAPPAGLSGVLRRMAYKQSENDIRRWLMLLLSDRVDVVEGIGSDLRHGKIPNIFQEMGLRSEWKYNRAGFVRKTAVAAAVVGVAAYLMKRRR